MTTERPPGSGDVPEDPEQLRQDIERTREQLGETVEALVAKTDVKAQARERVSHLTERLKGTTAQARTQLSQKTTDVKQAASTNGAQGRDQLQARATAVGSKVRDVTPEPVQRAARHAAARTSPRQATIVAVAAGVALIGFILVRRRRHR